MARCTVERRMRALGLSGAAPGRKPRATGPAEGTRAPTGLLRRDFTATGPNRRWVVDFTYVPTWSGVLLHRLRHGPVLPPDRRLGHQRAHGHRLRAQRPPGTRDLDAQGTQGRGPGGAGAPLRPRISVPVHRLHPTREARPRGSRPPPEPVGSSYDNAAAEALNKSTTNANSSARRPLEGPRRPRDRHRPVGELVQPPPDPTSPTTTTSTTTVEHRYNHNHTTTTAAAPATA